MVTSRLPSGRTFAGARGRNTKEIKSNVLALHSDGRKESKMLSIQFVKDQFGIETENDNLADAICIGWYVVNEVKINAESRVCS